jgi:hypothetical protein
MALIPIQAPDPGDPLVPSMLPAVSSTGNTSGSPALNPHRHVRMRPGT